MQTFEHFLPHTLPAAPLACSRVGGDAAKARKVAQLQNDVSALEAALVAAQQEYERVKARNLEVRAGRGCWAGFRAVCIVAWQAFAHARGPLAGRGATAFCWARSNTARLHDASLRPLL